MSFAVDANILLYAVDADSPFQQRGRAALQRVVAGDDIAYLFWPVLMAYLRIATHPRILTAPLPVATAVDSVGFLLRLPNVRTGGEGRDFWMHYERVTDGHSVRGDLVPDAHIVALMRQHAVPTIWTHDRGFRRFDGIRVVDPLDE